MCILYTHIMAAPSWQLYSSHTITVCGEMFGEKVSVLQPQSKTSMFRNMNTAVRSISIIHTFAVYGEAFCKEGLN